MFWSSCFLCFSAFSSPAASSELTDAQARYQELERSYNAEISYLIVFLDHDESQAKSCVAQYELSTVQEEVALKQSCQSQLTRLQSERVVRTERANSIKVMMDSAAIELEKLKASSGGSVSTGSGASAGSSTTTSSGAGSSASQSSSPSASSSTQSSDTQSTQSASDNPSQATPAPIPTPAQNSESQAATPAPTPSFSPSPTAVSGSKVSAAAKPAAKKRTITCVKGKVTRKVTAVKPVCPKGFKVKKK